MNNDGTTDANKDDSWQPFHDGYRRFEVAPQEIKTILRSLQMPPDDPQTGHAEHLYHRILEKRHASRLDVEDIFYCACRQLSSIDMEITVERWCKILSIPTRNYGELPRNFEDGASLHLGLDPVDLAEMMILLEGIGYSIDPRPMIVQLTPSLASHPYVNESEIGVLWYERERHKSYPIQLSCGQDSARNTDRYTAFQTRTGFTVDVQWNEGDAPVELTVTAPEFLATSGDLPSGRTTDS